MSERGAGFAAATACLLFAAIAQPGDVLPAYAPE